MIQDSSDFGRFWNLYPKKVNRRNTVTEWLKLKAKDREAALEALPNHLRAWDMEGRSKQMILDPERWLKGARWEDEIELSAPLPKTAVAWWATEQGVMAKGRELGVNPRGGESMVEFKQRVVEAARRAA